MTENRYINREFSWLQFNARVLQEAADNNIPLIERLRFIGIFSNNLDEFFMVRYATMKRIAMAGKKAKHIMLDYTAQELLDEITNIVIKQQAESLRILDEIQTELKKENIFIIDETEISATQEEFIKSYFVNEVSPALVTIILNDLAELNITSD
ncbi:MAG: polyphosphate kinase 1, partial [Flavobacteriaceae bacterium]|nr:polyphosphate kinase 1 [Flavobacteriaceae bacterium]